MGKGIELKYFTFILLIIGCLSIFQNCTQFDSQPTSLPSLAPNNSDTIPSPITSGTTQTDNTSQPEALKKIDTSTWPPASEATSSNGCSTALTGVRTFNVGPDKEYHELDTVPWLNMRAGDVVNIYYRNEPYRTKFGLRVQATQDQPFIINGVSNSNCQQPILSGENAKTAQDSMNVSFADDFQASGLIIIWRQPSDSNESYKAKNIIITNLKIINTHPQFRFYNNQGVLTNYDTFNAAVYARRVSYLRVENCELTGNSQAIFTNSGGQNNNDYSEYIIIRKNRIYANGIPDNDRIHGMYLQARRTLVEANFIGRNTSGSAGFNVKDRSSGTVIRNNLFQTSTRAIDLSETEEEYTTNILSDSLYPYAWLYGNIITSDYNIQGAREHLINFGYDNNPSRTRQFLYFYKNTVTTKSNADQLRYMSLINVGEYSNIPIIYLLNNIITHDGNSQYYILRNQGTAQLTGHNILPNSWLASESGFGSVQNNYTSQLSISISNVYLDLTSYRPLVNSPAVDQSSTLQIPNVVNSDISLPNLQPTHEFDIESYIQHSFVGTKRKTITGQIDLGALEQLAP